MNVIKYLMLIFLVSFTSLMLGVRMGSSEQGTPITDTGTTSFKEGVVYFNRQNVTIGLTKYAFIREDAGNSKICVYETDEFLPDYFVKLGGKIWSVERDNAGARIIKDPQDSSVIRFW